MELWVYKEEMLLGKGLLNAKKNELTMEGKLLVPTVSFARVYRDKAVEVCRQEMEEGILCVVVETRYGFYTVWREKVDTKTERSSPPLPQPIDANFMDNCQRELAKYIGPISKFIIEEMIEENPGISKKELIEKLALQIPNESQRLEFKSYFSSL